ncbi:hypothetical protein C7M84_008912 [Penaeus vannamei]|uniref:Alpha 1,4-glycosyltransferase domain-containing protein n=1 Tax=Penaeus vannamei TaxID=6689 RepID=A0A3R7PP29_PENVA|nr:hypothetical protein C7M84_008912 [Penaeus vannamei]
MQIAPGQNLARRCQRCPKGAWRWALLVLVVKLTILTINGYCLFYGCTPPKVLKTKVPPPKDNQRAASATVEKAEWWQEALCQAREEDEGVEMIRLPMLARDIEPDQKDYNIYLGETGCNPRPLFRLRPSEPRGDGVVPGDGADAGRLRPPRQQTEGAHGNLRVVGVDLDGLFAGTPVEGLFVSGNWTRNTRWPANNLSNLLRNVLLWRWGGLNSDTDCLCVRSVEGLRNVIAYDERASVANNAIMHFDARHAYVAAMMEYHRLNFKARNFPARSLTSVLSSPSPSLSPRRCDHSSSPPLPSPSPPTSSSPPPSQLLPPPLHPQMNKWHTNGPGTATAVAKSLCKTRHLKELLRRKCAALSLLPLEKLQLYRFVAWKRYFEAEDGADFLEVSWLSGRQLIGSSRCWLAYSRVLLS